MPNAYISGTGYYVPPRVVTNSQLRDVYGIDTTDEWIRQRTGIVERRFADEGTGPADLAKPAAEMALRNAGLTLRDIDMIVFATLSPESAFPGSGVYLQQKMGFCDIGHFVPALDVRNQCSGFVYGLATAASLVMSGQHRHVLLVGSEVHSAALDLSTRGRQVASLFGDGAGAVVVSATDEDRGVRGWALGADGRYAETLCQRVWDMRRRPFIPVDERGVGQVVPEMMWAHMDGRAVFKHAVERMIGALMQVFAAHRLTLNDVDLFVFHQANLRINEFIREQIGAPPDKFVSNIERYGNTTAATIPILLAEAVEQGRLRRGMKVAAVAFGSGFTWGAAIVDW
ncbi:MAG: ketoacyl-ACP synthase III [Myxococcota bacterium]|nr:ketoacyl-ACP synthase III [Myxococcota bacterium]MDW8361264.1 beta-ketoacyl-ACP synthase III [Myxococcales bacterium]